MKDQYGNKLVKTQYDGNYEVVSSDDVLYCIKRGTIQDIKALYKRKCLDEEFTKTLNFDYRDTVGGVLLFDYKVLDTARIEFEVKTVGNGKVLAKDTVKTQTPKGLETDYEYFSEVIQSLSNWVTSGITNGYYAEDKQVSQHDAVTWIKNILIEEWNTAML